MDFLTIVAICISGYCLYEVFELKKDKENDAQKQKEALAKEKVLSERMLDLQGKTCELIMKKVLLNTDALYSVKGVLEDMDEEWVLIASLKGKKTMRRIIRISNIKDVKEIKNN